MINRTRTPLLFLAALLMLLALGAFVRHLLQDNEAHTTLQKQTPPAPVHVHTTPPGRGVLSMQTTRSALTAAGAFAQRQNEHN